MTVSAALSLGVARRLMDFGRSERSEDVVAKVSGERVSADESSASLPPSTPPLSRIPAVEFGSVTPAHDPRVARPTGAVNHAGKRQPSVALKQHLQAVLAQTGGVIAGGNPDMLIQPFVSHDTGGTTRLLARALALRFSEERRPDVVLGIGVHGGILAFLVTEALAELGCDVSFLGLEPNSRAGSEGYCFLCPDGDIRGRIGGKQVTLVLPILTPVHTGTVLQVRALVDTEGCAAIFTGVATIVRYGDVGFHQVEALVKVDY